MPANRSFPRGIARVPFLLPLLVPLAVAACGGGNNADLTPAQDQCLRDADCTDGIDCTEDICGLSVNGVRRCEHVPRTDRCPDGHECLPESMLGAGCIERLALWCAGRAEGDPCTPDDACAAGAGTCLQGRCSYARKECAAMPCLVGQDRKSVV